MSVFGVILVRNSCTFFHIQTEYGEIRNISPYSVRMRENPGKMPTRKTPKTDTFSALLHINIAKKNTKKTKKFLTKNLSPRLQYIHVSILILFVYFWQCYLFIVTRIFFLEADMIKTKQKDFDICFYVSFDHYYSIFGGKTGHLPESPPNFDFIS